MKAKAGDKKVCRHCNGTGTLLFKMGAFTYSSACKIRDDFAQAELLPDGVEATHQHSVSEEQPSPVGEVVLGFGQPEFEAKSEAVRRWKIG